MAAAHQLDVEFRFIDVRSSAVSTVLGKVDGADVARGQPVRDFPTYKGQRNYPGWLWLATTRSLVGCESLLERDRLWLADFDPDVRWVASQPFWLSGRAGSVRRRHVPDFLLETADGYRVVDVEAVDLEFVEATFIDRQNALAGAHELKIHPVGRSRGASSLVAAANGFIEGWLRSMRQTAGEGVQLRAPALRLPAPALGSQQHLPPDPS